MVLPSSIQRAEDLVGIEMPMVPLPCACAAGARPNRPVATARLPMMNCMRFMVFSLGSLGGKSVGMLGHGGAARADEEIEVAALVGLQHVLDVQLAIAGAVGRIGLLRGGPGGETIRQFL